MVLLSKEEILHTAMVQGDSPYMEDPSMIKLSPENIPVQDYYQWQTVEEIQTQVNFLSL